MQDTSFLVHNELCMSDYSCIFVDAIVLHDAKKNCANKHEYLVYHYQTFCLDGKHMVCLQ